MTTVYTPSIGLLRPMRLLYHLACLALASIALIALPAAAAPVAGDHVTAELVAEDLRVAPGAETWLGLRLAPDAGWHVYWRNPGDTGLPTKIAWTLPAGVSAGDILWPYPQRLPFGGLVNYGYDAEHTLLVPLRLPADWPAGKILPIVAKASWLVCKDICIPGSASFSLNVATGAPTTADPARNAEFAAARARLPAPMPADWDAKFAIADGSVTLGLAHASLTASQHVEFFPFDTALVDYAAPQRIAVDANGLRLSQMLNTAFVAQPESKAVDGVLVVHDGDTAHAYDVRATPGAVATVTAAEAMPAVQSADTTNTPTSGTTLTTALLLALLGGLVLNLMPCVFPVLSLKALSLAHAGAKEHHERRVDALAYTAGIVLSFAALAALLLTLRAAGRAVGWGFQLQSPPFVALLAYLMFALGLSMSGVFTFGTRWMGTGQRLTELGGARGSFFTGVLAAVVASPCSAPFMGTATGFALAQSSLVAIAIFIALGIGLAAPFLLIGFVPALGARLPRPGAWMETLKQALAFPLYLTSAWLIWVLARQVGADAAGLALGGLVSIAFGLWLTNRNGGAIVRLVSAISMLAALAVLASPVLRTEERASNGVASAPSVGTEPRIEPYSDTRLAELRAQHRIVFVNFTADWCLSCKVNERFTLRSQRVRDAFAAADVVWLEGDWTRYDPAITRVLQSFGRSGVPLYLLYIDDERPLVLPQMLTPHIVINALKAKVGAP
jgi:thiol:disulfide interchange protein DsbD